jgi:RNA polymerase-interacting CarD/CdnL/TRCF family regulator
MGERGDIMEQTEIIDSCRVEETNPDRLALAEKVLAAATQCMEFEISLAMHKEGKKAETPPAVPGGYH